MISAENPSKGYGRQALFDEANFQINRRERVGLVGRNFGFARFLNAYVDIMTTVVSWSLHHRLMGK